MHEVIHKLQIVKNVVEAHKELFCIEIKVGREQLYKIEVKSARLKSKIGILKAKKKKLSQDLSKNKVAIRKNQVQPITLQKCLKNSAFLLQKMCTLFKT